MKVLRPHRPLPVRIDNRNIRHRTVGQRTQIQAQDARRIDGHFPNGIRPAEIPLIDKIGLHQPQGGLEADHPRRGAVELAVLFLDRMRGMVGYYAVDGAVNQPLDHGVAVALRAQRRVDPQIRIESLAYFIIGQNEVLGSGLGRHPDTLLLGLADSIHRAACGDVLDMEATAGHAAQGDISQDGDFLRYRRGPLHSQSRRLIGFVHHRSLAEELVLGVLHHGDVKHLGVLERPAHDGRVLDIVAVIGNTDHPDLGQVADLGQFLAVNVLGDSAHDENSGIGARGAVLDELDRLLVVDAGRRVGHTAHGRKPARGGRLTAGHHRLFVLAARFAQMHVHVDEARHDELPGGIDHLAYVEPLHCLRNHLFVVLDAGDTTVLYEHGGVFTKTEGRIDHSSAGYHEIVFCISHYSVSPSSRPDKRYRTAILTAWPLVTWLRITELSLSATSLESSTPRLMGPGCMIV